MMNSETKEEKISLISTTTATATTSRKKFNKKDFSLSTLFPIQVFKQQQQPSFPPKKL